VYAHATAPERPDEDVARFHAYLEGRDYDREQRRLLRGALSHA
jgi:hypothetical protein